MLSLSPQRGTTGSGESQGEGGLKFCHGPKDERLGPFPIEVLAQLPAEALRAMVDFEVGIRGVGRLLWPGTTDVSEYASRMAEVVTFKPHGVDVFTNASVPRPAAGEGLNKRCHYTMCDVFAHDKYTGLLLTDSQSIDALCSQLINKAENMGARMLGYDSLSGEWTVEVSSF